MVWMWPSGAFLFTVVICTCLVIIRLDWPSITGHGRGTRSIRPLLFLSDTFTCPILGPLVPLFWISGDVSSGFQSQSGFCLIRIAEANVMYIPWDPPLVLHIANLLTDSIVWRQPGSYLAQGYYCVAAVSLDNTYPRSTGHECCALTIRPCVPVIRPLLVPPL